VYKILFAVWMSLLSCLTYAEERAVEQAPTELASPMALVIFAVIFFGGIAYFCWFIWRKDRERQRENAPH
jgi:membrane protein DedA with SNARE-associated domain